MTIVPAYPFSRQDDEPSSIGALPFTFTFLLLVMRRCDMIHSSQRTFNLCPVLLYGSTTQQNDTSPAQAVQCVLSNLKASVLK